MLTVSQPFPRALSPIVDISLFFSSSVASRELFLSSSEVTTVYAGDSKCHVSGGADFQTLRRLSVPEIRKVSKQPAGWQPCLAVPFCLKAWCRVFRGYSLEKESKQVFQGLLLAILATARQTSQALPREACPLRYMGHSALVGSLAGSIDP